MRWLATMLVAVLVGLLLANSAATLYARVLVSRAQATLDQNWLRAQTDIWKLLSAYVDQETGERGYLLTGDPVFLQPYTRGVSAATRLQHQLSTVLATDATGTALLHQVVAAHTGWHRLSTSQIAERRAGPLSSEELNAGALRAKTLFDTLRAKLARLSERAGHLIQGELQHISDARTLADVVTATTVALALAASALALPMTRRVLTRPLAHLLAQLQRVEGGDYQETVQSAGAAELVAMAKSADEMRRSLLRRSDELVNAQRTLTLRGERDRLAADLHDRSIQRMFALGLSLSSLRKRHPELSSDLDALIEETDRGIREMRGIIFNLTRDNETSLRRGVDQVVRESARALGFTPEVEVQGPVDQVSDNSLVGEFLAVLREALSNVARHAHASVVQVTVSTDGDDLHLVVSDDGVGLSGEPLGHGIRNMEARAARMGGSFDLRPDSEGTTLEWGAPIDSHRST